MRETQKAVRNTRTSRDLWRQDVFKNHLENPCNGARRVFTLNGWLLLLLLLLLYSFSYRRRR